MQWFVNTIRIIIYPNYALWEVFLKALNKLYFTISGDFHHDVQSETLKLAFYIRCILQ